MLEVAGLSADSARLLRLGSNVVLRLTAPVVARITRPEADTAGARRMVAVVWWLESAAYPAVRALPLDQPIVLDSHAVTFWEAVSDAGEHYATPAWTSRYPKASFMATPTSATCSAMTTVTR